MGHSASSFIYGTTKVPSTETLFVVPDICTHLAKGRGKLVGSSFILRAVSEKHRKLAHIRSPAVCSTVRQMQPLYSIGVESVTGK
jgi:hypothetical protein